MKLKSKFGMKSKLESYLVFEKYFGKSNETTV